MKTEVDELDYSIFLRDTIEMELIVNDINARRDLTRYERIYNYLERKKFLLKIKKYNRKIERLEKERGIVRKLKK